MAETGLVVALLLACLVALVLVLLARREAAVTRAQAEKDVEGIKDEARTLLADAQRRDERSHAREEEMRAERAELRRLVEAAERRLDELRRDEEELAARREAAEREQETLRRELRERLEAVAGMSEDEARAEQVRMVVERAQHEAAGAVRRAEAKARRSAERRARSIVASAVQRVAGPTSAQSVVTVLPLP